MSQLPQSLTAVMMSMFGWKQVSPEQWLLFCSFMVASAGTGAIVSWAWRRPMLKRFMLATGAAVGMAILVIYWPYWWSPYCFC
jgi:hypothetical protein